MSPGAAHKPDRVPNPSITEAPISRTVITGAGHRLSPYVRHPLTHHSTSALLRVGDSGMTQPRFGEFPSKGSACRRSGEVRAGSCPECGPGTRPGRSGSGWAPRRRPRQRYTPAPATVEPLQSVRARTSASPPSQVTKVNLRRDSRSTPSGSTGVSWPGRSHLLMNASAGCTPRPWRLRVGPGGRAGSGWSPVPVTASPPWSPPLFGRRCPTPPRVALPPSSRPWTTGLNVVGNGRTTRDRHRDGAAGRGRRDAEDGARGASSRGGVRPVT